MAHFAQSFASNPLSVICRAIGEEIRHLVELYSSGALEEQTFVRALLRLERDQASPFGITLTASNTIDDWTVVMLRFKGCSEPCASYEFLPQTGEFRPVGFCEAVHA